MSFKLIAILKEALDVSWNPYEQKDIKQYDGLLNAFIRDVLKMAKDRSIYSRGLKKSEIPSEVYEQLRFIHDESVEEETPSLDAIMEDFSEDEVLERITELLSRFNLKEALDVSWNPYEESNYANKFYEFVDYDYSEGGPAALVFFRDEEGADLRTIVDLETGKILDASEWSGEGDQDVDLDLKVVEQLNQNEHIKDILRRWVHHINTDLVRRDLSEDLDVSWNPYEERNPKFKIGNQVYETGDDVPMKIIDVVLGFNAANKAVSPKKPVNWGEEFKDDFYYLVYYPSMDVFQWYPEDFLDIEPSYPELEEALDVSWNPYEVVDYANKFYESDDYVYLKGSSYVEIFLKDKDNVELRVDADLKTGKVVDAVILDYNNIALDPKVIEQLNQNEYVKDILRRWIHHVRVDLVVGRSLDEDLDISWNPYEDSDYTVMMGKLRDDKNGMVKHFSTKDEHSALLEFFIEFLGHDSGYAEIAASRTRKIPLKNSTIYKSIVDSFFWLVVKGNYDQDYMMKLSDEYRQKHNT